MSELTADCDALKEKIRKLEKDNEVLKRAEAILKSNLEIVEKHRQQQCAWKIELLKILGDTADHLGVSKEGSNQGVALSIWAAINNLRSGEHGYLVDVARAVDACTKGTSQNVRDSILVQFSKLKEEIGVLEADHQAALEGRDKELNEQCGELRDYNKKYQELDKAAKKALDTVGLSVHPEPYTVQQTVLDALEKLSEAALNDTVDSKLKELEQVCYSVESRSGVMCREENPWARVKWVLHQLSMELGKARFAYDQARKSPVDWRIKQKISDIQRSLEAWGEGGTESDEIEDVLRMLNAIDRKALEGQEIKAACQKLKELL